MPSSDLRSNRGAFVSALDWIDRPGQAIRNVIRGNPGAAGRQALDFLGDAADAFLPGDLIPEATSEEDYVSGSELVNVDRDKNPWLALAADVGVGIATDPLTFTGLGPLAKAAGAGAKALGAGARSLPVAGKYAGSALDALESAGKTAGREVRSVFGAQRLSPAAEAAITAQKGAASAVGRAGSEEVKRIVAGLTPQERMVAGDAIDNLKFDPAGKAVGRLSDRLTAVERVLEHPDVAAGAVDAAKVQKAVADALGFSKRQWDEGVERGIFNPSKEGQTPRAEYLQRLYNGETATQRAEKILGGGPTEMGQASAVKKLKLETPEDIASYLNAPEQAGVTYERDLAKRLSSRAQQQAQMAGKVEIGKSLVPEYVQANPQMRTAAHEELQKLATTDPESAKYLKDMLEGLPPRGNFSKALAKVTAPIKAAMVFGYAIPKVGSIVRNKVGGVWQALSNPEAGAGVAAGQGKRFFSDLYGAVAESIGAADKTGLGKDLALIDDAFRNSGGVASNAVKILEAGGRKDLAGMARSGVLEGFIDSEQLVSEIAKTPWKKKYQDITEWPARIFRGVEDRMRAGMYLDLVKQGKTAEEAARITRDVLYDYSVSSAGNRSARGALPFFQFTAKAIPQQAQFLSRGLMQGSGGTATAVGLANLNADRESPVLPYMEGKTNIPIGNDEQGNPQFISGLGLPVEALASIPNPSGGLREFGRDFERTVVASAHPFLKTAYSTISGRDPYFGSASGTYAKLPGIGDAGAVGRGLNILRGTGLTQPVESAAGLLGKLTDERKTAGVAALDLLTGLQINSVDPDRALQAQVTRMLESDPSVERFQTFYQKSKDPATQQALQLLREAKERLAEKRKAEQAKGSVL